MLLFPLLIVGLAIRLESPGPAIFKQVRMGRGGTKFLIFKFRTMRVDAPNEVATRDLVDPENYITKIGAFLRRTSLDELPQLLNILRGEMSVVGYRPVCVTETELNELRATLGVFAIRPGLTGLAQVQGRDNITFREKARIEAEYVRHCNIRMDLWCLIKTVSVMITGEGVI